MPVYSDASSGKSVSRMNRHLRELAQGSVGLARNTWHNSSFHAAVSLFATSFRTFLADFLAVLPQIELPAGLS